MPEYQTFLNGENMATFWNNVKWFLFFAAPVAMIFFAVDIIHLLIQAIRSFFYASDGKSRDDDDDYDVYYYR